MFGGLWQLAAENGVGLVADLKRIPVRQETIEVCEYFDLNPYELMAGGSLLILTENGGELVRALETAGVPAAVIGRRAMTASYATGRSQDFSSPPTGTKSSATARRCPAVTLGKL